MSIALAMAVLAGLVGECPLQKNPDNRRQEAPVVAFPCAAGALTKRRRGALVGVGHIPDITFGYYPPMRFRRETKFSEEQTASTGAGGRQ